MTGLGHAIPTHNTERKNDMTTKQARELAPGDVVDGRHIRDGAARMTVARISPAFGGRMIGVVWSSGQVSHLRPYDLVTVHHTNTIGGAL